MDTITMKTGFFKDIVHKNKSNETTMVRFILSCYYDNYGKIYSILLFYVFQPGN